MDEHDWLAERFEEHRTHLRAVAYRMLGSLSEADDAVQEAWLRLSRADASEIENLGGWLTTVVARVCLNMLRSRESRREEPIGRARARPDRRPGGRHGPRARGAARRLGRPRAARRARDAQPGRAARLRASRRVRRPVRRDRADRRALARRGAAAGEPRPPPGAGRAAVPDADLDAQREVVDAFFAAAREGDFERARRGARPRRRAARRPRRRSPRRVGRVHGAEAVAGQARDVSRLASSSGRRSSTALPAS